MSEESEEILRTFAAVEMSLREEIKKANEKLDRALVLLHAIERDAGTGEAKKK